MNLSRETLTDLPKPKTEAEINQLITTYNGRESAVIAGVLVSKVIVPAINVYVEAIEKVVRILSDFLTATRTLSSRFKQFKKQKSELYFNCAKKKAKEIIDASYSMIGHYDTCHVHLNAMKYSDLESYNFAQEILFLASIEAKVPTEPFTVTINKIISENTHAQNLALAYPDEWKEIQEKNNQRNKN